MVATVFMVNAEPKENISDRLVNSLSIGVSSNVVFNDFSIGLASHNLFLDRLGAYTDVNFKVVPNNPTRYSVTVGGSLEFHEDLYLLGGYRFGIQQDSMQKAEAGVEYKYFDTVAFNVKAGFPFEWRSLSFGVRFDI